MITLAKRHPFIFGTAFTAFKTGAMDVLVQKYVEKRETLDKRRMLTFGTFGFLFNGVWQYALFVKLMPRMIPNAFSFASKPLREKLRDSAGMKGVLFQNFVENGINNPILYFPLFYMTQQFIDGGDISDGKWMSKYLSNAHEDLPAIWALWVPAQLINFGFSPKWFRVPFVAVVSSVWTGYVSLTRGNRN